MLRSQCDSLTLFQRQTTSNRCTYHQTYSKTKKEGPVFPIHALLVALGSEDTNGIELVFVYFLKNLVFPVFGFKYLSPFTKEILLWLRRSHNILDMTTYVIGYENNSKE